MRKVAVIFGCPNGTPGMTYCLDKASDWDDIEIGEIFGVVEVFARNRKDVAAFICPAAFSFVHYLRQLRRNLFCKCGHFVPA